MKINAKRKWRWGSKTLFAPKASKIIVFERSTTAAQDRVVDQVAVSLDGCSAEDADRASTIAAKVRRNGSKILSIAGISTSSGKCFARNRQIKTHVY